MEFNPSPKQWEAWQYLTDHDTTELGYGGGANGGKTWLGCTWIASMALAYPGTRWAIGRKQMTDLRITTMKTLFKLFREWGLIAKKDFRYKEKPNEMIVFANGSEILFLNLAFSPTDPEFHRLGSLELTGAWVEESAEVRAKAIGILRTRVGRCENARYKIKPKVLETFNPDKGHVFFDYFKPWKNGSEGKTPALPPYRRFVRALITDNPRATEDEIEQLRRSDKITRERLLEGNFEYDDDPSRLFDRDDIFDMFTTKADKQLGEDGQQVSFEKFVSCDVARKGRDTTRIGLWHGLQLKQIITLVKKDTAEVTKELERIEQTEGVRRSHFVVDEDGVGGGVVDQFKGCRGFLNNASPIQPKESKRDKNKMRNYANLKTQCAFELARLVKEGKVGIDDIGETDRDTLVEEFEQVKQDKIDSDSKICLVSKDVMKEKLGRSPDIFDMVMMRMLFEVQPRRVFSMTMLGGGVADSYD